MLEVNNLLVVAELLREAMQELMYAKQKRQNIVAELEGMKISKITKVQN